MGTLMTNLPHSLYLWVPGDKCTLRILTGTVAGYIPVTAGHMSGHVGCVRDSVNQHTAMDTGRWSWCCCVSAQHIVHLVGLNIGGRRIDSYDGRSVCSALIKLGYLF